MATTTNRTKNGKKVESRLENVIYDDRGQETPGAPWPEKKYYDDRKPETAPWPQTTYLDTRKKILSKSRSHFRRGV
jgi:hypothetical protein